MATMEELETTKTEPEKKPVRRARVILIIACCLYGFLLCCWDMFYFIAQARMWR